MDSKGDGNKYERVNGEGRSNDPKLNEGEVGQTEGFFNSVWNGAAAVGNMIWTIWSTPPLNPENSPNIPNDSTTNRNNENEDPSLHTSNKTSRTSLGGHQRANSNPERISNAASYLDESDYGIRLVGRGGLIGEEALLTNEIISKIHSAIPSRFRLCTQWRLLYSTVKDGYSLGSLFSHCKHHNGPTLIVVRDDGDCLFGVFATETWKPHFGHYGTGECFLWRRTAEGRIQKYGSTGKNAYFMLTERDYLAAGCGDGKFGFWVDEELLNGQSYPVDTFDNEVLASQESFKCINVELWGLDMTPFSL